MWTEYKVLTGSPAQVEAELNGFNEGHIVNMLGLSTDGGSVTVVITIHPDIYKKVKDGVV